MLLFTVTVSVYLNVITFNEVTLLDGDKGTSNTINVGANVQVNRDAAEAVGRNIGVAGTVAGVAGAVAKGLAKSSLPPLAKAGVIVGSGVAGGAIFVGTSAVNRVVNKGSNITTSSPTLTSSNLSNGPGLNKFFGDSNDNFSDLMVLLLSIDTLTLVCLSLTSILFIIILFKFFLNENNIKLNLSSLIGDKLNNSLNYYIIKIIKLNKKANTIFIFIIFIVLFIALAFNCYFITELYNNLDKFIELHINSRK